MAIRFRTTTMMLLGIVAACANPPLPIPEPAPPTPPEPVAKVYVVEDPEIGVAELLMPGTSPALQEHTLGHNSVNNPVYLSNYFGQVVVVSYWTSQCPVCRRNILELEQIHKEYNHRGVVVVGVNVGEANTVVDTFINQQTTEVTFTILQDESESISKKLGVYTIPTTTIYDETGSAVMRYTDADHFDPIRFRKDLDRALGVDG